MWTDGPVSEGSGSAGDEPSEALTSLESDSSLMKGMEALLQGSHTSTVTSPPHSSLHSWRSAARTMAGTETARGMWGQKKKP